jgi:hypothetical protein
MTELTENEIRAIAKEEALKVQTEVLKEISEVKSTLSRLERLLLGEIGTNEEDTLKARANFAYLYAKKNTDLKIIERAIPALDWFHDMDCCEKGERESKLESLGKLIGLYNNIKWILGLIGVTTIINAVPVLQSVLSWIKMITG